MTHESTVRPVKGRSGEVFYVFQGRRSWPADFADALSDLAASLRMWRTWTKLGWRDYRHQTRGNLLGPVWSVFGLLLTVGALGYVYGALLSIDPRHGYPFVAAGMIAWFFIAGCVGGGPSVFLNAAGLISERTLPLSFSVYRYTYRLFVEFCIKFTVFAIIALLTLFSPGRNLIFLLPGMALFFLNGLWVTMLLGVIGTRFRDVGEIIGPLMLIVFLSTPILWPTEALQYQNRYIAHLNPFTHFIALIREPLLGAVPSGQTLAVVLAMTLIGWLCAVLVFARTKNRVVFWL